MSNKKLGADQPQLGKVWLVGAGPGDFGLITLNGLEAIRQAEVLVYDRLINEDLLAQAPADCEKIYVGKQAANHALPQPQINELLYQQAGRGLRVVRLKGGDPYVFGRGGEEGMYLAERGVPVEVIPGITSSIAGPAYAGIPVTHRECASSFHVFTGNFKEEERSERGLDFDNLARLEGTLIFLMGFANLNYITQGLLAAGKAADTPVAVISQATTGRQRTVTGVLRDIESRVAEAGLSSPAITVIGRVVECRDELNFFEPQLAAQAGQRAKKGVLILRDARQSAIFIRKLQAKGLTPQCWPVIEIVPRGLNDEIKTAINGLADYSWLVFTSPNGVQCFMDNFYASGGDWRGFSHLKFAVIGRATAQALRERAGFNADFVPAKQVSDALGEGLAELLTAADNVLLPRSAIADNRLLDILRAKCPVTDLKIYDTHFRTEAGERLRERLQKTGYVPFTSASTVDGFVQALGGPEQARAALAETACQPVAIGPATARRMNELGITPALQAAEHSLDGVIEVILQDIAEKNKNGEE